MHASFIGAGEIPSGETIAMAVREPLSVQFVAVRIVGMFNGQLRGVFMGGIMEDLSAPVSSP